MTFRSPCGNAAPHVRVQRGGSMTAAPLCPRASRWRHSALHRRCRRRRSAGRRVPVSIRTSPRRRARRACRSWSSDRRMPRRCSPGASRSPRRHRRSFARLPRCDGRSRPLRRDQRVKRVRARFRIGTRAAHTPGVSASLNSSLIAIRGGTERRGGAQCSDVEQRACPGAVTRPPRYSTLRSSRSIGVSRVQGPTGRRSK